MVTGLTQAVAAYLLLLLPLDFFSPPWLLRLLLALARSLRALLVWLALAPLLAASERPMLPPEEDEDEDFELREAIERLLEVVVRRARMCPATP